MGTLGFRYLIHEHRSFSVVLSLYLHLQNLLLYPAPLPTPDMLITTLRFPARALTPFPILSCPQLHAFHPSQIEFPCWLGSFLPPVSHSGSPDKTQLWLNTIQLSLPCLYLSRKHTVGPANLILKSGLQISNEVLSTWHCYCISLVSKYFLTMFLNTVLPKMSYTVSWAALCIIKTRKSIS